MPSPPESKTVLFSDIVGSSKLYQRLGNQKAEEQIRLVIQTLSSCTTKHSGVVIKTIGDEIMCAFNNLPDASDCASEMNALTQESKVELRTGISSGKLITRDGDLFGDVVNNAAFLTKIARAREILIDEMALDSGGVASSKKIELIAEMTIKGQSQPSKIYRLNWEHSLSPTLGATMINNLPSPSKSKNKKMKLEHLGKEFLIDSAHPVFVIGRDKTNVALKINHVKISRKHCSIEFKQGKFIFQDHSTNGSFVLQNTNEPTQVHRESFALLGSGKILLGQIDPDENCTLSYIIA